MPKEQLEQSIERLRDSIEDLEGIHKQKSLLWSFLRGITYGLGLIVAVAIVIPLIVLLLQSVQWVPLLGDFIAKIVEQIQQAR